MSYWWNQLDKTRGSQPRCVLFMDGDNVDVAARLTALVNHPEVLVTPDDRWMPYGKPELQNGIWNKEPVRELRLDKPNPLLPGLEKELESWWLAYPHPRANTLNWDMATTCTIRGQQGILLVEAKAHANELGTGNRCEAGPRNRPGIESNISHASAALQRCTGKPWALSCEHHYQLSNRFAWSWKLATLGVPVVLVYLGFLDAQEMADQGPLFDGADAWEQALKAYGEGVVDNTCWGTPIDVGPAPMLPLIRALDQPFERVN